MVSHDERHYYRYVGTNGTTYKRITTKSHADAVGLELATGDEPDFPKRWKPRRLICKLTIGDTIYKRVLIFNLDSGIKPGDSLSINGPGGVESYTVEGTKGESVSRLG